MRTLAICTMLLLGCSAGSTSPIDAGNDALDTGAADAREQLSDDLDEPDKGAPPECKAGEFVCSPDGYILKTCKDGKWLLVYCMLEHGRLCQEDQCVDPWVYDNPKWSTCPDEPLGTPETLWEKAAYYDDIASRLHLHPDLKWVMSVSLDKVEAQCPAGEAGPCYESAVPEVKATYEDVIHWHTGENDGLWSALYTASQAYRYAVTGSPDALSNLTVLMEGEVTRMEVTGVPGVFTRQFIPPGIPGIQCPQGDASYVVDVEKDDNRWVKIGEDGCAMVVDNQTMEWVTTDHCVPEKYAGYCWLDNVSQDEYAGHMYALGVVARLVDDPWVHDTAVDLLEKVADHLIENDLQFIDWDGRVTEHGHMYPTSMSDAPGFAAILALDYILMAGKAAGRPDFLNFYNECLLQRVDEPTKCLPHPFEAPVSYLDYTNTLMLFLGPDGCLSNFNNHSMLFSAMATLVWYETDIENREFLQNLLDQDMMRDESPKAGLKQKNCWYDFIWAANKKLGPQSDGPAYAAVEDGICMLKQFPASKSAYKMSSADLYPHFCDGRLGNSLCEFAIPVAHRCAGTFTWWNSAFSRGKCEAEPWKISKPSDYLLAYWMGRYHGFIKEEL